MSERIEGMDVVLGLYPQSSEPDYLVETKPNCTPADMRMILRCAIGRLRENKTLRAGQGHTGEDRALECARQFLMKLAELDLVIG